MHVAPSPGIFASSDHIPVHSVSVSAEDVDQYLSAIEEPKRSTL